MPKNKRNAAVKKKIAANEKMPPKKAEKKSRLRYFLWIAAPVLIVILVLFKTNKLDLAAISDIFRPKTIVVEFPQEKMSGAWVWESPDSISRERRDEIMAFAKAENIDTLFLDISGYTDIVDAEEPDNVRLAEFTEGIKEFIRAADGQGIKVHALGGNTSWGFSEEWYIPLELLEFVMSFNDANPGMGFSGIQYDIEYYNNESYEGNEQLRDSEFIMLVEQIMRKVNLYNNSTDKPLRLGFVIPYWLQEEKLTAVFEPLMELLNENGGSYVVVLAYRTRLDGEDGTLNIAKDELDYAELNAPRVSVVIGQETDSSADATPAISFYGRSKADVRNAMQGIISEFGDYSSFGGVAINQLSSFEKLKN